MKPKDGLALDIGNECQTQKLTPLNVTMAIGNAMLAIRCWEYTHQCFMEDVQQIQVIMAHISDFIRGRAFVAERRKDSYRAFVDAICPDQDGLNQLEEALLERRRAA